MKDLSLLWDYIDYYVYSHEDEKIHVQDGEHKQIAEFVYIQIADKLGLSENGIDRWAFDIALDFISTLNEKRRGNVYSA